MRAAIYTRVSQDREGALRSVKQQYDECLAFCEENGWTVAGEYRDNDRSASRYTTKSRPNFEQLIAEIDQFDVVVTWEASRATRDLEVYVKMLRACRTHHVKWAYSGSLYDLEKPGDARRAGSDVLDAEYESGKTSERVQRSVRAQAQAGKPHGRLPYGYVREYDPATGSLVRQVPHPEESRLLVEAADRVLAGESLYGIAKDMKQRGHPLLDSTRLQRLLRSPTYAGKRVYRGEVIRDAEWEPIIPQEKWEAVQGVLGAPDRAKFHGTEPRHLLTGIAVCGTCSGPIIRLLNKGKYGSYVCKTEHCVARSQPGVDALVTATVKLILRRPDFLERYAAYTSETDPRLGEAIKAVRDLEAALDGFYQQAVDGSLSPAGLAKVEAPMIEKIDAARTRRDSLRTPQRLVIGNPVELAEQWDDLPLLDRRAVVAGLMHVRILKARAKGVKFDPNSVDITQRF
ncbi:recombinase family protein [Sinomonas albida]|uniref:recombinase family protein n=1 Tax=Sinomonas albida TaxID=369942 RepID=UPI003016380F